MGCQTKLVRTYLKIVDSVNIRTYQYIHATTARRPMGTDSGAFPRRTHSGQQTRPQTRASTRHLGGGALDSEHGCAMAHAAPVLSQLQDGASPLSTVVRTRGAARDSHAVG